MVLQIHKLVGRNFNIYIKFYGANNLLVKYLNSNKYDEYYNISKLFLFIYI